MTAFLACITEAAAAGDIDEDVAGEAAETYQAALEVASKTMGPSEADRQAAKAVMTSLEREAAEAARRTTLAVRTRRQLLADIAAFKVRRGYQNVRDLPGGGGKPPKGGWRQGGEPPKEGPGSNGAGTAKALPLLMRNKPGLSGGPFASVEGRYLAVRGLFDAQMADLAEKFQAGLNANILHQRGRAVLANVVKEAFGEDSGDAVAKMLAKSWADTAETARKMFNAAGGAIGKMEHWGLPQAHNAVKIYRAGKDAWTEFTVPLLDRDKMIDRATGQPFTEKRLRAVMSQSYDQIVTHGLISREPGENLGAGMLAKRRAEERFFAFKDADRWSQYQAEFGQGDAYAAMMGHLDGMAHDIGLMQILGPNPEHQFKWLANMAEREAAIEKLNGAANAVDTARKSIQLGKDFYDTFTGAADMPANEGVARAGSTLRSYLSGALTGGAMLAEGPAAPIFGAAARALMGINLGGDFGQFVKLLFDPEMRGYARRMGFINEVAHDGLANNHRDTLRLLTVGEKFDQGANVFARRLPSSVLKLSGLTPIFNARKNSFRMSAMGALADAQGKSLADLRAGDGGDRMLERELSARGFSEQDWAKISRAQMWQPRPGVSFLRPQEIAAAAGPELAARVGEMVLNAEQWATPVSGSLYTHALVRQIGGRRGTPWGELSRSVAQFKTFPVNVAYLYGSEIFYQGVRQGLRGMALNAYVAGVAAAGISAMTVAGAIQLQLKQVVAGKDPLPVDDWKFWGDALVHSGALGLWGDFFYSNTARNDHGKAITALGPVGSAAGDAWDLTGGEALDAYARAKGHADQQDHFVSHLAHDAKTYTPYASLWWARAAFDRMMVEQLQKTVDPNAAASFAQHASGLERETGQQQWWPEGSALPSRAPNLAAAVAPPPQR